MYIFIQILYFLCGLVLLIAGADRLVKGAKGLAFNFGISPVIIGLTIVAYGTSMPEFVASLISNLEGADGIAIGNVVGSNIANFGLVLGLMAILKRKPVPVDTIVLKRDYRIMLGCVLLFFIMSKNLIIGFYEGAFLFLLVIGFTVYLYLAGSGDQGFEKPERKIIKNRYCGLFILIGIAGLWYGSKVMVEAAVTIARLLQVSDLVIGLTIVAIGTSLPELATSVISLIKKESELAIGNLIGSNIFNILFVIGGISIFNPVHVDKTALSFDIPFMILFLVVLYPVMAYKNNVTRLQGIVMLVVYSAYIIIKYLG